GGGGGRPGGARGRLPGEEAPRLRGAGQAGPGRLGDGLPQARHPVGREALRPAARPRPVQDRRGRRLQLRRDGEQGPQHLQHQVRARALRYRHRHRLPEHRPRGGARVLPQLDRQPRDLPRLVPAVAEGRPDGMPRTLLGEEKFQAGMRLYFKRHDGQAVTCDDFVQAMQDASGIDLSQFKLWYDVAGTPVLDCRGSDEDGRFTLTVKQSMNPPFHIPLAVKIGPQEQVLSLRNSEETFTFKVAGKPVPSLLRRFSAPVILNYPFTEEELVHLMGRDDDAFNRWEAGQRLASSIILDRKGVPPRAFLDASRSILSDRDPAFAAEVL